jgi:hypothetical protein
MTYDSSYPRTLQQKVDIAMSGTEKTSFLLVRVFSVLLIGILSVLLLSACSRSGVGGSQGACANIAGTWITSEITDEAACDAGRRSSFSSMAVAWYNSTTFTLLYGTRISLSQNIDQENLDIRWNTKN